MNKTQLFKALARSRKKLSWYLDNECIRAENDDYRTDFCPLTAADLILNKNVVDDCDYEVSGRNLKIKKSFARNIVKAADFYLSDLYLTKWQRRLRRQLLKTLKLKESIGG